MYKYWLRLAFGILIFIACLLCPLYAEWFEMNVSGSLLPFLHMAGGIWVIYSIGLCVRHGKFSWAAYLPAGAVVFFLSVRTYGDEEYFNPADASNLFLAWGMLVLVSVAGAGGLIVMFRALRKILAPHVLHWKLWRIKRNLLKRGVYRQKEA